MDTGYNHIFNQHWTLYQKILVHDYMGHQRIFDQLATALANQAMVHPLQVLDIGCGDAQTLGQRLAPLSIHSYTGIDLSAEALDLVKPNVACAGADITLINTDFEQAIGQLVAQGECQFDVIFAGFALHHVLDENKARLFKQINSLLTPNGRFYLIDVYMQEGESREAYLERYLAPTWTHWNALDEHETSLLNDHVRSSDFPSTKVNLERMAKDAGFSDCTCLLEDHAHANILMSMGKGE